MKEQMGGNFMVEAINRLGKEQIITDLSESEAWLNSGVEAGALITDLARADNPNWQINENRIKPPLIYGTVDGGGNVAELLMMLSMAKKIGVPMALTLDENAYDASDTFERLTKPSLELIGVSSSSFRIPAGKKMWQLSALECLPGELIEGLDFPLSGLSLADVYKQVLYLIGIEFFGEETINNLSILPTRLMFGSSEIGNLSMRELKDICQRIARSLNRNQIVLAHDAAFRKVKTDEEIDNLTLGQWYENGGWLGGTAWVTLMSMMVNKSFFEGAGPMVLAEKNTALGGNFAAAYKVVLPHKSNDSQKIAVSAIRRIKANMGQEGGDGVDPLIFWLWLKTSPNGVLAKEAILDLMETAFPIKQDFAKEGQICLTDKSVFEVRKIKKLKEDLAIDGKVLMGMGFQGRLIGATLAKLADLHFCGQIGSREEALLLIKNINDKE